MALATLLPVSPTLLRNLAAASYDWPQSQGLVTLLPSGPTTVGPSASAFSSTIMPAAAGDVAAFPLGAASDFDVSAASSSQRAMSPVDASGGNVIVVDDEQFEALGSPRLVVVEVPREVPGDRYFEDLPSRVTLRIIVVPAAVRHALGAGAEAVGFDGVLTSLSAVRLLRLPSDHDDSRGTTIVGSGRAVSPSRSLVSTVGGFDACQLAREVTIATVVGSELLVEDARAAVAERLVGLFDDGANPPSPQVSSSWVAIAGERLDVPLVIGARLVRLLCVVVRTQPDAALAAITADTLVTIDVAVDPTMPPLPDFPTLDVAATGPQQHSPPSPHGRRSVSPYSSPQRAGYSPRSIVGDGSVSPESRRHGAAAGHPHHHRHYPNDSAVSLASLPGSVSPVAPSPMSAAPTPLAGSRTGAAFDQNMSVRGARLTLPMSPPPTAAAAANDRVPVYQRQPVGGTSSASFASPVDSTPPPGGHDGSALWQLAEQRTPTPVMTGNWSGQQRVTPITRQRSRVATDGVTEFERSSYSSSSRQQQAVFASPSARSAQRGSAAESSSFTEIRFTDEAATPGPTTTDASLQEQQQQQLRPSPVVAHQDSSPIRKRSAAEAEAARGGGATTPSVRSSPPVQLRELAARTPRRPPSQTNFTELVLSPVAGSSSSRGVAPAAAPSPNAQHGGYTTARTPSHPPPTPAPFASPPAVAGGSSMPLAAGDRTPAGAGRFVSAISPRTPAMPPPPPMSPPTHFDGTTPQPVVDAVPLMQQQQQHQHQQQQGGVDPEVMPTTVEVLRRAVVRSIEDWCLLRVKLALALSRDATGRPFTVTGDDPVSSSHLTSEADIVGALEALKATLLTAVTAHNDVCGFLHGGSISGRDVTQRVASGAGSQLTAAMPITGCATERRMGLCLVGVPSSTPLHAVALALERRDIHVTAVWRAEATGILYVAHTAATRGAVETLCQRSRFLSLRELSPGASLAARAAGPDRGATHADPAAVLRTPTRASMALPIGGGAGGEFEGDVLSPAHASPSIAASSSSARRGSPDAARGVAAVGSVEVVPLEQCILDDLCRVAELETRRFVRGTATARQRLDFSWLLEEHFGRVARLHADVTDAMAEVPEHSRSSDAELRAHLALLGAQNGAKTLRRALSDLEAALKHVAGSVMPETTPEELMAVPRVQAAIDGVHGAAMYLLESSDAAVQRYPASLGVAAAVPAVAVLREVEAAARGALEGVDRIALLYEAVLLRSEASMLRRFCVRFQLAGNARSDHHREVRVHDGFVPLLAFLRVSRASLGAPVAAASASLALSRIGGNGDLAQRTVVDGSGQFRVAASEERVRALDLAEAVRNSMDRASDCIDTIDAGAVAAL